MNRLNMLQFFLTLLSLTGTCLADDAVPVAEKQSANASIGGFPPPYSGPVTLMPPPEEQASVFPGNSFAASNWLALACEKSTCRLVQVKLAVEAASYSRLNYEDESFSAQRLLWDLTGLKEMKHVVMLINANSGWHAGPVTTWYSGLEPPARPRSLGTMEALIPTPVANNTGRQSVLVPMLLPTGSVRVQLREGKVRQWLGNELTIVCTNIDSAESLFPRNYLRWVGDLDNDQKPDYLIWLGANDGYTLFLSSRASLGQLAGEAGHFQFSDASCD